MTAAAVAIILVGSLVQFGGRLRAINPRLSVGIRGSARWYTRPVLAAAPSDPGAVYVVVPEMPSGDRFAAVRVNTDTGAQSLTNIVLGAESPFRPFMPAPVHAEVHGLHFLRPAVHLLTFPGGKGPGVHLMDSATGRIDVVLDESGAHRRLLSRSAFNGSDTPEVMSLVSEDPNGRWVAALARDPDGWMLYLFSRQQPQSLN